MLTIIHALKYSCRQIPDGQVDAEQRQNAQEDASYYNYHRFDGVPV